MLPNKPQAFGPRVLDNIENNREFSLELDPLTDSIILQWPDGACIGFAFSSEEMVEISKWAFTRKTVHIILGERRVDPFSPISASQR